jgi:hypothetical protein
MQLGGVRTRVVCRGWILGNERAYRRDDDRSNAGSERHTFARRNFAGGGSRHNGELETVVKFERTRWHWM